MNWLALTSKEKSSFISPVRLRIFHGACLALPNCRRALEIVLRAAGAIGTLTIMNPASMDIPWSRVSVKPHHLHGSRRR